MLGDSFQAFLPICNGNTGGLIRHLLLQSAIIIISNSMLTYFLTKRSILLTRLLCHTYMLSCENVCVTNLM